MAQLVDVQASLNRLDAAVSQLEAKPTSGLSSTEADSVKAAIDTQAARVEALVAKP